MGGVCVIRYILGHILQSFGTCLRRRSHSHQNKEISKLQVHIMDLPSFVGH